MFIKPLRSTALGRTLDSVYTINPCVASMKNIQLVSILTLLISLTSCAPQVQAPTAAPERSEIASQIAESDIVIEGSVTTATLQTKSEGIEVTWEVPSEGADGFILRYGTNPLQLNSELSLAISDLREERDTEYGPVYRYLIRATTDSSPVFVSIASRKGDRVSNFSEAIEEAKRPAVNHTSINY